MNKNIFLAVLLAFSALRGAEGDEAVLDVKNTTTGVTQQSSPLTFAELSELFKNMTPEQQRDFDDFLDAVSPANTSAYMYPGDVQHKAISASQKKDAKGDVSGFQVKDSTDLPSFSDIVGGVPDSIKLAVHSLKKKSNESQDSGKKRKKSTYRLLLYGPPGTGKTTIAKACAKELGSKFMEVKGTAFIDGYIATGTDRIHKLFEKVRGLNEPVVLFIDEIDAIARERTKERNDEYANTLIALIQELDHCEREAADRVFVILATNKFGTLDEALRSRCSSGAIEIKAPSADLGQKIMLHYLNEYDHEPLSRGALLWIKFWTRGFAGREFENMIKKADLLAEHGTIKRTHIFAAMNEAYAAFKSGNSEKETWFKKIHENYLNPWSSTMSAIHLTAIIAPMVPRWGAWVYIKFYKKTPLPSQSMAD